MAGFIEGRGFSVYGSVEFVAGVVACVFYVSIAAGIEEVGPSDDEWTTALIVITDGEDTGGGPSPAELAAQVRNGGPRVFVVAVGEATCADPDLSQIITASGGGCVHAGFDTLDRALAGVTEVIWGGDPDDH